MIAQPNAAGRVEFFEELLPAESKQFMGWLVQASEGYSGAQIVNIVDTAQMIASYNSRLVPNEADYQAALMNCQAELDAVPESAKAA